MVESNVGSLMGTMWSFTFVSFGFVVARGILKYRHGKFFAADDWSLLLAWCFLLIYTSLVTTATTYGLGYHFVDIPPKNLSPAIKFLTISECFAILALQTSKTSFAITLLRLVTRNSLRWILWCIIITLNIAMGINIIINLVSCRPIQRIWNLDVPGKCWDPEVIVNVSIFAGVYSGVMDLLLAGFPFLLLKPLNMEKREKYMICFAMSLGFFAGVAAFIKSSYLPQLRRWTDVTFSSYIILIWASAEACICMIATCIPYFRLFISHASTTHRSGGYQIKDEELQLGRVILDTRTVQNRKSDWTPSTISEGKRVSVPANVRRASEIRFANHVRSLSAEGEVLSEMPPIFKSEEKR